MRGWGAHGTAPRCLSFLLGGITKMQEPCFQKGLPNQPCVPHAPAQHPTQPWPFHPQLVKALEWLINTTWKSLFCSSTKHSVILQKRKKKFPRKIVFKKTKPKKSILKLSKE